MDLEEARKTLSKRRTFTPKRVAFFGVAGLCLVAGIALRAAQYFGPPDAQVGPPPTVESAPPAATIVTKPQAAEPAPAPAPSPAAAPAQQAAEPASPTSPPAADTAEAAAPQSASAPEAPAGDVADAPGQVGSIDHAEQPELPGDGMILVSRRPIEVLAGPSPSSPSLYGFPAGRPFRVIGHEAGFAHIQDLRSKASGWIEEAALAAPPSAPAVSTPSQSKVPLPAKQKSTTPSPTAGAKAKPPKSGGTAATDTDTEAEPQPDADVAQSRRPGLFGRGGLFGGIFGGGN